MFPAITRSQGGFLTVLRYILRNPEAAGICRWDKYRWSSASSYLTGMTDGVTDITQAYAIIGDKDQLYMYINENRDDAETEVYEPEIESRRKLITDSAALQISSQKPGRHLLHLFRKWHLPPEKRS